MQSAIAGIRKVMPTSTWADAIRSRGYSTLAGILAADNERPRLQRLNIEPGFALLSP